MSQFVVLDRHTARQREQVQALARPTRVRFSIRVDGTGETRVEGDKALIFGTFMLQEPTFTFGSALMGRFAFGQLPHASAFVSKWVTDERDLFVGAEVAFRIDADVANVSLIFYLVFEGYALRTNAGFES